MPTSIRVANEDRRVSAGAAQRVSAFLFSALLLSLVACGEKPTESKPVNYAERITAVERRVAELGQRVDTLSDAYAVLSRKLDKPAGDSRQVAPAAPDAVLQAATLTLRLTSKDGSITTVADARAYQSSSNTIPTKHRQLYGVEVSVGSGRIIVPWSNIQELIFQDDKDGNWKIVLMDGSTKTVPISNYEGLTYIGGKTELGSFEAYVGDLKLIEVLR